MTSLQKVKTIATFEFLTAVKRVGYLVATFGMPLFVAGYGLIVAIPAYFAQKDQDARALYGVVDEAAAAGDHRGSRGTEGATDRRIEGGRRGIGLWCTSPPRCGAGRFELHLPAVCNRIGCTRRLSRRAT